MLNIQLIVNQLSKENYSEDFNNLYLYQSENKSDIIIKFLVIIRLDVTKLRVLKKNLRKNWEYNCFLYKVKKQDGKNQRGNKCQN